MKKVALFSLALLVVGFTLYYISSSTTTDKAITNESGVNIIPPDGWRLWEVVSASMNKDDNAEIDQEYLSTWTPENAEILAFTSSDVAVETRDLSRLIAYTNQRTANLLVHDVIVVNFKAGAVDSSVAKKSDESVTKLRVEMNDLPVSYTRIKAFSSHDIASVSINLGGAQSIVMIRNVAKDLSDDDILSTFSSFIGE